MNSRSKKILAGLVLACCLTSNAYAGLRSFVLLGIPQAYMEVSAAMHVAGAAVGAYFMLRPNSSPSVTSSGDVTRPANVAYVDLTLPQPAVVEKQITAKLPMQTVKDTAKANPSKYPNVNAALTNKGYITPVDNVVNPQQYPNGTEVSGVSGLAAGQYFVITGVYTTMSGVQGGCYPSMSGGRLVLWSKIDGPYGGSCVNGNQPQSGNATIYNGYTVSTAPTPTDATPSQFASTLAASGGSGPVKTAYQAELDKMVQDPAYVPTFTDDSTGLPPAYGNIATPAQTDAYNKRGTASVASQAVVDAANANVAAAQTTVTSRTSVYGSYQTAYGANDPRTVKAGADLDKAKADLAKAQADAAGATSQDAKDDAAAADKAADTTAQVPPSEERKKLDFSPLDGVKGAMENTYPFNLPSSIKGYYSQLVGDGSAPKFDLPLPLGQTMHVDLAIFDPVAQLCRFLIGILTSCGVLYYIIHFFRGIS